MDEATVSGRLRRIIEKEIRDKGPIPFARFMEICLYHPQYGYYSLGRGGDYVTAPTIHSIFGTLIGKQIAEMWQILGEEVFEVVEMGGGEGYLSKDILDYLQQEEAQLYEVLLYRMVEISPRAIERQKRLLVNHEGKVFWHQLDEVMDLQIQGCFLSNELIDSFPVHRVVMEERSLQEVYVDLYKGAFKEVQGEPSTSELAAYFRRLGIILAEGQHAEVNLEALRWLQIVAQRLVRGFVVTIDYGYPAQELYTPLRREGTFLCYRDHGVLSDPYENIGLQDMTAHVDFTSLILWGEGRGLQLTGLVPQYRFLLCLGILEQVARLLGTGKGEEETLNERLAIKNLLLPGEMGETFKVLIQHKGIDKPQLEGLRESIGGEEWSVRKSSVL